MLIQALIYIESKAGGDGYVRVNVLPADIASLHHNAGILF